MNHYEEEKIEFELHFKEFREKRIVLYGIGRFTATLIPLLHDWNIVGLMDKDPEKVGTFVYGLPIVDLQEAESKADVIIINTSGSYWDVIYQRIKHTSIPVYYRNGVKAEYVGFQEKTQYWNSSYEQLKANIDAHEIVSFDFFDTLFCRKLYMPGEIWEYIGDSFHNSSAKKEFLQARRSVYVNIKSKVPNICDIYENILFDAVTENGQTLMQREIDLECKFMEPRRPMLSLLRYAIEKKKNVYIISDMYLMSEFFIKVLEKHNIYLRNEQIWISCECGSTKKSGELWKKFQRDIVKEKSALHIGDDWKSDINSCKQYTDMNTYFVMSKNEMMQKSSVRTCLDYATSSYHNIVLGLCGSRLFRNPFILCKTRGRVEITDRKDFGYSVFGPVIFSFTFWLSKMTEKDGINHLCFLGRDGFFLKQDFEYLYSLLHPSSRLKISYLEASRQILMCAGIENENDFMEYMKMPYEGKLSEFFEDRLQISPTVEEKKRYSDAEICMPQDYEKIREILYDYREKITDYIKTTKSNYKNYLKDLNLNEGVAVVDLGFYGTTQHYLSKLLGREFIGYYIVANNADDNIMSKRHVLKSCTSIKSDKSCKSSYIHSMGLAIKSFLTSPHGMVRTIRSDGQFLCAPDTNNQKFFVDKTEINDGIQLFMKDIIELHQDRLDGLDIHIDDFIDNWYGIMVKNIIYSEEIKRSFYNDNAFIHRRQERIFDTV